MEYQDWIDGIFNCEPIGEFELDWTEDFCLRLDQMPNEERLQHISLTFERSGSDLMPFSDIQTSLGINSLTNETYDSMQAIYDVGVPLALRLRTIESFVPLYRDFFTRRCDDCVVNDSKSPLNLLCYMMWDAGHPCIYSFVEGNDPDSNALCKAFIDMLEKILFIPHLACQQSALHGLGHSIMTCDYRRYPKSYSQTILDMINRYLKSPVKDERLVQYAKQAKTGQIL